MLAVLLALACATPSPAPLPSPEPASAPAPVPAAAPVPDAPPAPEPPAAADPATAPAEAAALSWLAVVDAGAYGDSYDQTCALFRATLSKDAWITAVSGARTPLGAVSARTLMSATPATTLPGAPPGEYVVIQYKTAFANRPNGVETITPMKDADGTWRVSGYFVK